MADEAAKKLDSIDDIQEDVVEADNLPVNTRTGTIKRILSYKVIVVLVILTVVINGVGVAYYSVGRGDNTNSGTEHDLGNYHFLADLSEKGQIAAADFQLHIAVIEDVGQEAYRRLHNRKFRVQQDIEELLRQAHSGDFTDPTLGELKRRIQARINETLEMRAIADVIITDLKLSGGKLEAKPPTETTESMPWVEDSST